MVLQSCRQSTVHVSPYTGSQVRSIPEPSNPINRKGVQEMVDGDLKQDGVIVFVDLHLTEVPISFRDAAVCDYMSYLGYPIPTRLRHHLSRQFGLPR